MGDNPFEKIPYLDNNWEQKAKGPLAKGAKTVFEKGLDH